MQINTVNLTYAQTLADEAARERARKPRHYPSGACAYLKSGRFTGKCRRATWLEWNGATKTDPIDAPALFKMRVGDLIHEMLDGLLNRALEAEGWAPEQHAGENGSVAEGIGAETSLIWQSEGLKYPFSGRLDKRFVKGGVRLAAEWKSTYGRGADFIKKDGPKEDALLQVAVYLEQDTFPVDEVALMYAARDSGYLMGYAITKGSDGMLEYETMGSSLHTVSEVSWEGVKAATLELESALEDEAMPPPRDYGPQNPDKSNKWRCDYCSYAKLCNSL
jgi:hypothetical protein